MMFYPLYKVKSITLPIVSVLLVSITLLTWQVFHPKRLVSLNITSLLLGILWAVHITIKSHALAGNPLAFLMVSLLCILFISTIAFINDFFAFILNTLPVALVIFWFAHGENTFRFALAIALPTLGIAIQSIIQKRNESFTYRLMDKLQEEKNRYSDLSMLDPLTGLYNRRGFQNRFDSIIEQSSGPHYILLLDVDRFKSYNDHYGHSMGDQTLMRVATTIRDAVRSRDIVSRYGGEEFLIMLTNVNSEHALQSAERIRSHVYGLQISHQFNDDESDYLTVSIGLTPLDSAGLEQALILADKALYDAKNRGRNKTLTANMPEQG